MPNGSIRIGTRGSPLALIQAEEVRGRLVGLHGLDPEAIEIRIIKTSGDRIQDRPLSEVGGKGLFTKEIEEALLDKSIDLAVHSMKDVATVLPDGLVMAAILEREDVRDAFISLKAGRLADLAPGSVVGTASLRRQAQVRRLRPDLRVVTFRGNVGTRLKKLEQGEADATILALAGLKRLGQTERATSVMATDEMLPAVAQGALGLEIRADDVRTAALVSPLAHAETARAVTAERAFLRRLDGSCKTPIAGLAQIVGDRLRLRGMILTPDGGEMHETMHEGAASDAEAIGSDAAAELLTRAGLDFLREA
ncbi:MAG: hydroxymethylbilane synthase [Hyphomicrobiaceae bacterium]